MFYIFGCGGDSTSSGNNTNNSTPSKGQIGAACDKSSDCEGETKCLTEKSFAGGYCYLDCEEDPDGCPKGSSCESYLKFQWCMDSCDDDTDCREDDSYVCDYGVCRPPCSKEEEARFCAEGESCRDDGHCRPPCKKDSECPDRCQEGDCLPPCKKDTACLPGQTCDTDSGTCKDKPGKKMGESCSKSSECATAYCLPTRKICSIRCAGYVDCPKAYACGLEKIDVENNGTFDEVEADCLPRKGEGGPGAPCAVDDDCAAQHCYNGLCLEGCKTVDNCLDANCTEVRLLIGGAMATYQGCLPKQAIVHNFSLGTFKLAQLIGLDIPKGTTSFIINTKVDSTVDAGFISLLKDPTGTAIVDLAKLTNACDFFSQPNRYRPTPQISTLMVPNSPDVEVKSGMHEFYVSSTNFGEDIEILLSLKIGAASKGSLNINYFFANLGGECIPDGELTAASAPTHSWFSKIRGELKDLLGMANIAIGKETYHDVNNPALDVITVDTNSTGAAGELEQLFATSNKITGSSVNVFFVRAIESPGMWGGPLGVSGGLPGPPALHGTISSGVVLSMQTACYETYGYHTGHSLAHEIGHYLGLSHNIEQPTYPGIDPVTKEIVCSCPCGPNLTCEYDFSSQWCRGMDNLPDTQQSHENLMYFAAESEQQFKAAALTPNQIDIIQRNPLTGHE